MSRWDWDWYEPSVPRPAKDGLKARAQRGSFSKTWWGKRWIRALDSWRGERRLPRGRSYARRGQVVDLEVTAGQVAAAVQGSRPTPYQVRIGMKPLSGEKWERALQALAGQASFAAQLLAGEMPQEVDEIFASASASLFPATAEDLAMDCSCPDWAVPCKHVAAVHYLLAEEIDRDPFLLFTLRGKDREAVMLALRQAWEAAGGADDAPAGEGAVAATEATPPEDTAPLRPEGFWDVGAAMADWRVALGPPAIAGAILRRLGAPDFADDPEAFARHLEQIYARVSEQALKVGLEEAGR
jgi:uncharacterized Zn finger protein